MDTVLEMRRQVARASFEAEQRGAPGQLRVDLEGVLAALAAQAAVPERGEGRRQLVARGRAVLERWQAWGAAAWRTAG